MCQGCFQLDKVHQVVIELYQIRSESRPVLSVACRTDFEDLTSRGVFRNVKMERWYISGAHFQKCSNIIIFSH